LSGDLADARQGIRSRRARPSIAPLACGEERLATKRDVLRIFGKGNKRALFPLGQQQVLEMRLGRFATFPPQDVMDDHDQAIGHQMMGERVATFDFDDTAKFLRSFFDEFDFLFRGLFVAIGFLSHFTPPVLRVRFLDSFLKSQTALKSIAKLMIYLGYVASDRGILAGASGEGKPSREIG
jgi:site-specific recombinase XerC